MNSTQILEKLQEILHTLPPLLEAIVEGPDVCSSLFLLLVLYWLAKCMVATQPTVVRTAFRVGIGAAVGYIALVFWRSPPSRASEFLVAVLRCLITGGLFCTGSCIVLPIISFVWNYTIGGILRWLGRGVGRTRRWIRDVYRQQAALFSDFRRRERRQVITAEEREHQEREAALRQEQALRIAAEQAEYSRLEELKQRSDRKRREDARLQCLLAYDRFGSRLAGDFQRERLTEYFNDFFTGSHSAEEIEERATKLIAVLDELGAEQGHRSKGKFKTLSDVVNHFNEQRRQVQELQLDSEIVDSLTTLVNQSQDSTIASFLKGALR